MTPYYNHEGITIYHGDCREVLPQLEVVDLIVTDPQYGISQPGVVNCGDPAKGTRSFGFFVNDTPEEANNLALEAWRLCLPLCSDAASAYWWVGHQTFGRLVSAYELEGWKTRFLVWSKLFRNEGPERASNLVKAAMEIAWERWPGERLYTYVNPKMVRKSRTPGRCFLKAGWKYVLRDGKRYLTKWRKLLVLEAFPGSGDSTAPHTPQNSVCSGETISLQAR